MRANTLSHFLSWVFSTQGKETQTESSTLGQDRTGHCQTLTWTSRKALNHTDFVVQASGSILLISLKYYFSYIDMIQGGNPGNFYYGRSIEIRVKFALLQKISTRDNLLRKKVCQGALYYGFRIHTTGKNL